MRFLLRHLALIGLGLYLTGCFITSTAEEQTADQVEVSLSIGVPAVAEYALTDGFDPWDKQGLFHLVAFPKLVRLAVEYEDYELTSATWPDPQLGVGEGEDASGEVGISLTVPAGRARTLRALGFIASGDEVQVYRELEPYSTDLVAGSPLDATLAMVQHDAGSVSLTIRCVSGNQTVWVPIQVSLVDARALVLWPPVLLTPDQNQSLKATVEGVPVDRPHWARVIMQNGVTGSTTALDVRHPTFIVGRVHDKAPVDLEIPCSF